MKHLVGKTITESIPFMGESVDVKKLTVSEVMELQTYVKAANKSKKEEDQITLLKRVITTAVIGASDITDEEFNKFPIDELNKLSEQIMRLAGLGSDRAAGN